LDLTHSRFRPWIGVQPQVVAKTVKSAESFNSAKDCTTPTGLIMLERIDEAFGSLISVANKTSVLSSRTLDKMAGDNRCFLKCENFQRTGSFKFRGAYNAVRALNAEERRNGIVTHSSGNHAQALALAGSLFGVHTTVVMPTNSSPVKIDATRSYGAEVILCEPSEEARERSVKAIVESERRTLIHPFDNRNVIAGQGVVALELLKEIGDLQSLFVPIGGGGLISGCAIAGKGTKKVEKIIGVEPEQADDAFRSFYSDSGKIIKTTPRTIADGLRTSLSNLTFGFIREFIDEIVTVSEQEIISAMKFLWERMKIVVEPSGAVSLAGLLKHPPSSHGNKVGIIISGGNIDLSDFFRIYITKVGAK